MSINFPCEKIIIGLARWPGNTPLCYEKKRETISNTEQLVTGKILAMPETLSILDPSKSQNALPSQTHDPLLQHDVPERPWQTVCTDQFHWNNRDYLFVMDYYS